MVHSAGVLSVTQTTIYIYFPLTVEVSMFELGSKGVFGKYSASLHRRPRSSLAEEQTFCGGRRPDHDEDDV